MCLVAQIERWSYALDAFDQRSICATGTACSSRPARVKVANEGRARERTLARARSERENWGMNVYVKGAIVAVILAAALFAWYQAKEPNLPVNQSPQGFQLIKQMETQGVPEIELEKLDGTKLALSSLRGKIVIVNFWASWCNPCTEEFPSLVKLVGQFKDDVVVLAVSEDDSKDDIQAFLKAMGFPKPGFEVVWDKTKENMPKWGVEKVPETFLVGRDGKLIRKVLGIDNWANDDSVGYFKMLIKDSKPKAPEDLAKPGPSATPTPAPTATPTASAAKSKSKKKKKHRH